MRTLFDTRILALLLVVFTCLSPNSFAAKIYTWYETGEDGKAVQHFGPSPPIGVESRLIADEGAGLATDTDEP